MKKKSKIVERQIDLSVQPTLSQILKVHLIFCSKMGISNGMTYVVFRKKVSPFHEYFCKVNASMSSYETSPLQYLGHQKRSQQYPSEVFLPLKTRDSEGVDHHVDFPDNIFKSA